MIYQEVYEDLFLTDAPYLAHCISSDYAMGAGIAVLFQKKFHLREQLNKLGSHKYPEAILVGRVFNLVTKNKYWMKPTRKTIRAALEQMRDICLEKGITDIAMPKIGAGLDRRPWMETSEDIQEVFKDTNIRIRVYIH